MGTQIATGHWKLSPGSELPCWEVCAANDAEDSNNRIHDNTVAQQLGFGGGLVPGVTLYGYLTRPLVAVFGREFLMHGGMQVRFRRPVYTGDHVRTSAQVVKTSDDRCELQLELRNAKDEVCVQGIARMPGITNFSTAPPIAELPPVKRPATPEELRRAPVLGSLHETFGVEQSAAFVTGIADDLALYQSIVHPAWLLRQANYLVDRNLALGPWIHTASEIQHLGVVQLNEPFTVCGKVIELSTHKGNDYADVDVLISTTQPVMRVLHRAIYRMGAVVMN